MHIIDLPAGSSIQLTATALPRRDIHRWTMRLFTAGARGAVAHPLVSYGSQIGGRDCDQRIHVPIQDKDCRIEVTCGQAVADGWREQQGSVEDDTPGLLVLGFADSSASNGPPAGVVLNFAISGPALPAAPQ